MWRVPTDIPQVAVPNGLKLAEVTMDTPLDEVFKHWKESGAVILKKYTYPSGSEPDHDRTGIVPRLYPKRLISSPSRPLSLPRPQNQASGEGGHNGDYWLSTASTLNASGPQPPQVLHRDLTSYPPYAQLGPEGTEAKISFLFAFSDFREDNGATRIIPGSNKWPFHQRGNMKQTIPAEMKKGDCLLIGGKVIHGMGENKTETERKCIQLTVVPSFLTPSEAQPFIIKLETVKKLSKRAQRFVGFRSQYPRGSPGLWTKDYIDLALHLGLDDFQGTMKDLQHVIDQPKQWDMIDYDNLETEKSADISC
ncbi:hypothetical protein D8B26_008380 [Coccidioides posadasii str. Silveira]|uniref:uncharacterized protein n=2 Tax=Coccidioides posadasii (strain RMSCC 757 / Silveira) TaxID=443226 RepID=UPI001BEFCE27|nr:hypothetical protein D8B26_008380 [Coccidioides posadasii str. Silveira]